MIFLLDTTVLLGELLTGEGGSSRLPGTDVTGIAVGTHIAMRPPGPLRLTWAGLAPAGTRQLAWRTEQHTYTATPAARLRRSLRASTLKIVIVVGP